MECQKKNRKSTRLLRLKQKEGERLDNPCYGCKKRHTRCHVDCTDYAEFKRKRDAQNKRRKAEIAESNDYREAKKRIKKLAERG